MRLPVMSTACVVLVTSLHDVLAVFILNGLKITVPL